MSLIVYKGYAAKVDFDAGRVCLAGKITGIEQDIFFYGKTLEEIQSEFHKAVDAYIGSLKVADRCQRGKGKVGK